MRCKNVVVVVVVVVFVVVRSYITEKKYQTNTAS